MSRRVRARVNSQRNESVAGAEADARAFAKCSKNMAKTCTKFKHQIEIEFIDEQSHAYGYVAITQ